MYLYGVKLDKEAVYESNVGLAYSCVKMGWMKRPRNLG